MKKRDFIGEVRGKSAGELRDQARQIADEMMKLRFRHAGGQLEQTHQLGQLRKNLARIKTVLAEKAVNEAGVEKQQ